MEGKITDSDEELYRQIHPHFVDPKRKSHKEIVPTSQAFQPGEEDDDEMSVDRSSLTTAEDSYNLYVANGGNSVAVFSITVGKFCAHNIACMIDPLDGKGRTAPNPAHAYADFSEHSTDNQKRQIAKKLKRLAIHRGQCYP